MTTYSRRQREIIGWFHAIQNRQQNSVSLDKLHELLERTDRNVKWTRNGIAAIMRDLQRKLPNDGCKLNSNNARGKGNKLEFTFEGNFRPLLTAEEMEDS